MTFRVNKPNDFTLEVTNWPGTGATGKFLALKISTFTATDTGTDLGTNGTPTTIMHGLLPISESVEFAERLARLLNANAGA